MVDETLHLANSVLKGTDLPPIGSFRLSEVHLVEGVEIHLCVHLCNHRSIVASRLAVTVEPVRVNNNGTGTFGLLD